MRIGGPFPFGQNAVPISLQGGEIFMPPPGNYLYCLGNQTCLQHFDPINYLWRNVAWPGSWGNVVSADGYNFRLVNLSGVAAGALITNAGSGGTNGIGPLATGTTVTFAPPASGFAATGYAVVGGKLNTIAVTAGGSGFLTPPRILIDPPPPGGVQATATATVSNAGVITGINVINPGAGYINVPNVYVIPQFSLYPGVGQPVNASSPINVIPPGLVGGTLTPPMLPGLNIAGGVAAAGGAVLTASALTGSGTLTAIVMTYFGQGYIGTAIPAISFAGGGLAGGVAATAIMSFAITALGTGGTAGAGYTVGTPWESSYGLVAATDGNNNIFQPRAARGLIAATTGFTGTAATIEDNGFGLQKVPNIGTTLFTTQPTTVSTTTAVCGGVNDTSILQPAVED